MVWITGARISHDSLPFNAPQGWVPLTHRESNCLRGAGVVVYPSALSSAAARATPCECGYVNHCRGRVQRRDERGEYRQAEPSPWLLALGPMLRGTYWETIAVPELRVQARRVAETLLGSAHVDEREGQLQLEYMI